MDERRQYTPTNTRTYAASETTVGIQPESIVIEAATKENDYKNVKDVPNEHLGAMVNSNKFHKD